MEELDLTQPEPVAEEAGGVDKLRVVRRKDNHAEILAHGYRAEGELMAAFPGLDTELYEEVVLDELPALVMAPAPVSAPPPQQMATIAVTDTFIDILFHHPNFQKRLARFIDDRNAIDAEVK